MATKKVNPLLAQKKRQDEQDRLVKNAMGAELSEPTSKKTKMTISITEDDAITIKKLAIENKTNVSALIHEWIQSNS